MNDLLSGRNIIRRRIIDAALKEFSTNGFCDAKLRSIAKNSGISLPQVYYYMGNRQSVYDQLIKYAFDLLIERYLQPVFSFINNSGVEPDVKLAILLYAQSLLSGRPAVRSIRQLCIRDIADGKNVTSEYGRQHMVNYLAGIEDIIKQGVKKGIFETPVIPMIAMNIVSFTGTSLQEDPVFHIYNPPLYIDNDGLYQSFVEFIFKTLTPAGGITAIPVLDVEIKKRCSALINNI